MSFDQMIRRSNELIDEAIELQNEGQHAKAEQKLNESEAILKMAEAL